MVARQTSDLEVAGSTPTVVFLEFYPSENLELVSKLFS